MEVKKKKSTTEVRLMYHFFCLEEKNIIIIFGQILIIQSTVHSDRNVLWLLSFYAKNINALDLWAYVQNGKAIERCVFQKPFFPNDFLVKWKPISLDLRDQTLDYYRKYRALRNAKIFIMLRIFGNINRTSHVLIGKKIEFNE